MSTKNNEEKLTRRSFLKTLWGVIGGVAALEFGGVTLAYMQPRLAEGDFGGIIEVGSVDTFPSGSVTHIPNGRFYLSRLADGGFLAIYQRCTHLGCSVPWDQTAEQFICPCHNSQFTSDGELLNPPAPRPLDIFPVIIEDGIVMVDTSQPMQRASFEPSQLVYA
ncbi:MAG: Rieske 2Fe-2S domain-containing protein [Chloroflexota bacterium]